MQQPAVGVDMGVIAGIILHHGVAVPEVPGVPVAFPISRGAVGGDVKITARVIPHRTPALLEIAAPGVAFHVEWSAVRPNVMPAVAGMHRGNALIEPEGPEVSLRIGRTSVESDVVGARGIQPGARPGGWNFSAS